MTPVTTPPVAQTQVWDCWFHGPSSLREVSGVPLFWTQIGIAIKTFWDGVPLGVGLTWI